MSLIKIDSPSIEPITLAEAKTQCRILHSDDDADLINLIQEAREYCETYCERAFISTTFELYLDEFPNYIQVPFPDLISITSIKYLDEDEAEQTLDPSIYRLDNKRLMARIYETTNNTWPATACIENAVKITFTAGFGATRESVPAAIKRAIKLLISHWYENREPVIIGSIQANLAFSVDALLAPYRQKRL